ncbi:MAG: oligosaccharide flippase family protein [Calditrichia bacterium]
MSLRRQISNLARHSAIYAISTAMQRLPGLLLIPIYTNFDYIPSTSDFSNYVLVYTFIAFMNFFYLLGLDSAMMRYFFLDNQDRKSVFSATFWMLLVTCSAMSAVIWLMDEPLAALLMDDPTQVGLIHIAAIIPLVDAYANLAYNVLRAEEKSIQFTLFKSLRFLLELGLNVLFVVVLKYGVPGIFYTSLGAALINLLVMLPVLFRYLRPKIDWQLAKSLLAFGLPLLPNGIAFMTIELVDNFLVKSLLSKEAVAVYRANYRFGAILLMLVTAFRNAWQPFFLKIANKPDARDVYARVFTYYVTSIGLFTLVVSFFIGDLLTFPFFGKYYILSEKAYWAGTPIIPIILLSYYFFGIYVILTPGFYIRKKTQYMIIFTGTGAAVNILANLWLLPLLNSFWGAAWSTLFSYLAMTITIYLFANRIYPLKIEWGRVSRMLLLIAAAVAIFYLLQPGFGWRILLMTVAVFYCIFGILNHRERQLAVGFLKRQRSS